jgi:hypothetical protein
MYPPPKRRWPGLLGAYVALCIVLAVPSVPIYYYVEPPHKLLVIRVCAAIILAFTLYKLAKEVHERLEQQPSTGFEAAARPPANGVSLAPQFEKLQDEVTYSLGSRTYFEHILRPRLLRLLERKLRARFGIGVADLGERPLEGVDPKLLEVMTHPPSRRTLLRRRVPRRQLRALVQTLEEL